MTTTSSKTNVANSSRIKKMFNNNSKTVKQSNFGCSSNFYMRIQRSIHRTTINNKFGYNLQKAYIDNSGPDNIERSDVPTTENYSQYGIIF
uniref:Uncharacterized protein n=1 Tax=Rhizophagus irregularis (strain DAOM 181602 / DAOM 197198 / MUCL 43194) TaxID=747089 RepID=U9UA90_RHIID